MSTVSRHPWRMSIPIAFAILALILSLVFSLASKGFTHAAGQTLIQISQDPFHNTLSQHKTEVEPDSFAFGNTIVSAFQQGRVWNGGGADIGFATSTNGGNMKSV